MIVLIRLDLRVGRGIEHTVRTSRFETMRAQGLLNVCYPLPPCPGTRRRPRHPTGRGHLGEVFSARRQVKAQAVAVCRHLQFQ